MNTQDPRQHPKYMDGIKNFHAAIDGAPVSRSKHPAFWEGWLESAVVATTTHYAGDFPRQGMPTSTLPKRVQNAWKKQGALWKQRNKAESK